MTVYRFDLCTCQQTGKCLIHSTPLGTTASPPSTWRDQEETAREEWNIVLAHAEELMRAVRQTLRAEHPAVSDEEIGEALRENL